MTEPTTNRYTIIQKKNTIKPTPREYISNSIERLIKTASHSSKDKITSKGLSKESPEKPSTKNTKKGKGQSFFDSRCT
jgi:hypothetical protein